MTPIPQLNVTTHRDRDRRDLAVAISTIAAAGAVLLLVSTISAALAEPEPRRIAVTPEQERILLAACDIPRYYGEATIFTVTPEGRINCWEIQHEGARQ